MTQYIRLLTVFIFCSINAFSQVSFYADSFTGGVTGGGYAPDNAGNGTGVINVHIAPGSTIRKAFLFAGRQGEAMPVSVTLNSIPLTFDSTVNQVSPSFQSPDYGGTSAVHAIDVTSIVSASDTSYSLMVPVQNPTSDRYTDFYLFIAYANSSLTTINTEFFVNEKNFGPSVIDTFNLTRSVNSTLPVAVGLDMGYMCGSGDADQVWLNGTYLGLIYGPEGNSGACEGPCANFYYQNNAIFALLDNDTNQAMNGPDVLSGAQAIIPNGSTSFTMTFTHSDADDSHWGFFIVSGGCATPVANTGPDTVICSGNTVQLYANGGSTYHWSPTTGLSDSTIANPKATPSLTTAYIVTVSNSCGSSTDTVNIVVLQSPPTPTISQSNDTLYCSADPTYTSYQWSFDSALIAGATDTFLVVSKSGNYNVQVSNENGCKIAVGINIILGIQNYVNDNILSLYPNPATDELLITGNWKSETGRMKLTIFNVLGETIYTKELNSKPQTVNCKPFPSGVYFVQIANESGRWVGKFVKE